jgi:1,4-alpha-glucan branching enzyme
VYDEFMSELTDTDIYHFREGTFFRAYDKLGAHPDVVDAIAGTRFAVWAPNARSVHVMGDFNGWERDRHPMTARPDNSGIWEAFIPQVGPGTVYKYFVRSRYDGYAVEKSDPYAFRCERLRVA